MAELRIRPAARAIVLDPDDRILLVADERLSYDEIAALTEQSPDAVRGKLHRARKAFTTHFHKSA